MRATVNGLCKLATKCLVYIIWAAGFRACGAAFAVYITTLHNFNFDFGKRMFGHFSRYYVNGARPLEVARFSPRDATYMDFIWNFHMVSRHSFFPENRTHPRIFISSFRMLSRDNSKDSNFITNMARFAKFWKNRKNIRQEWF